MEIIHLILGKANPQRMNGVNSVVYQLATKQVESGRNVAVWGITRDLKHNYGKRVFETRLFKASRNPFGMDPELKAALKSKKDSIVVHLHGGWIPVYSSISKFLKRHKIRFVLTPHGAYNTIAMQRSGTLKKMYFKLFEKNLLTRATKIHSIGESEITGLMDIFPNRKSVLLPYGFDAKKNIRETTSKKAEFVIGFVGRIDIYTKGLDLLVKSFGTLIEKGYNSKLWIIGDSKEIPLLKQLIQEAKVEKQVVLWGGKFGDDKAQLMSKMDIFVHPSRNEGLPAAVLEACNQGIPCVVSQATNLARYIQEYKAGISVENESVESLTSALITMADKWKSDELKLMSGKAAQMVEEAFNWNIQIEKFDNLYGIQ